MIQSREADATRYRRWGVAVVLLALTGSLVALLVVPPQTCQPGLGVAGCEVSWGAAVIRFLELSFVWSIPAVPLLVIAAVMDAHTDLSAALLELSDQIAELSGDLIGETSAPTPRTPHDDIGPLTVEQRAQLRAELLDQRDAQSQVAGRRRAATDAAARLRRQRPR